MRDLAELNINQGGRPITRPPPSVEQIAEFEREFGLTLPPAYLALLRHANGGHPELNTIFPEGGGGEWGVNHFFHLSEDKTGPRSLWAAVETWRPIVGQSALPVGEDGGGNLFFIDTAVDAGAVKVCIHDDDFSAHKLATSFEDFIDRLAIHPDCI